MPPILGTDTLDSSCMVETYLIRMIAKTGNIESWLRTMFDKLIVWVKGLFISTPVKLVIVRRYEDANGSYVGELYMWKDYGHGGSYMMIGASLDSFPLDQRDGSAIDWRLDTANDFLAPLPLNTVRVGAMTPMYNESVRRTMRTFPRKHMKLEIMNRLSISIERRPV